MSELEAAKLVAKENMAELTRHLVVNLSKLCSRGGIERLVKTDILPPLEFSDIEQCIDCIKGKYIKKIKKGANRSTATPEIIHTDICGPFSVKSVDGYDSFITFTDDYSR